MEAALERFKSVEETYTLQQRQDLRRMILYELESRIREYEKLYEPAIDPLPATSNRLTKERYARFETWIGECGHIGRCPPGIDEVQWRADVKNIVVGYRALQRLVQGGILDAELLEYCTLQLPKPQELFILREQMPNWTVLPSELVLKTTYHLDSISEEFRQEYGKGKTLQDFALKEEDFLDRVSIIPEIPRQRLLHSIEEGQRREVLPPAKIVFIADLIQSWKQLHPNHEGGIMTNVVLELLDRQGLRPATLAELLTYARYHWKSNKHAYRTVCALGSVVRTENGGKFAPQLKHVRDQLEETCKLTGDIYNFMWDDHDCFLVFNQE